MHGSRRALEQRAVRALACGRSPAASTRPSERSRRSAGRRTSSLRREGPYVCDVEGTRYIDLVQSYGAVILGHAHPAITAAIVAAAADGTSFGAPTPREMKLAEAIAERVPSCERVRLMNSGTEAT